MADFQHPGMRIQPAVARVARRQHAIEHVHARRHRIQQILRRADPHQIARLIRRQLRGNRLQQRQHLGLRLADREPAERIARKTDLLQRVQRFEAQILIHAALNDAEQCARAGISFPAARRPAHRAVHRLSGLGLLARVRRAFIKGHDDIRAEIGLHPHRGLRIQKHLAPVRRGAKPHAALVQSAHRRQAEHLKPTRIGQNRMRPVHELMQPAMRGHHLDARTLHQMKGVAEDDLRPAIGDLLRRQALDRARRADRHERRGVHRSASQMQASEPGLPAFG